MFKSENPKFIQDLIKFGKSTMLGGLTASLLFGGFPNTTEGLIARAESFDSVLLAQVEEGTVYSGSEIIFVEDLLNDDDFAYLLDRQLTAQFGQDFLQNQEESLAKLAYLHDSFLRTRSGEVIFPPFYGGSYLNDKGRLVTLLVEGQENIKYSRVLGDTRFINYSYQELNNLMGVFFNFLLEGDIGAKNINAITLDTIGNKIVVELHEYNFEKIQKFENYILNHSALYFTPVQHESVTVESLIIEDERNSRHNIFAGWALRLTSNGANNRSIGYRARRGNRWGFVTAAHRGTGSLAIGQRFYNGTNFVGAVELSQLSGIDAAFVPLANGVTMSNNAANGWTVGTGNSFATVGATATRISTGNSSTPVTSAGTIRNTSHIWHINGQPINSIRADGMLSRGGDSGGIVVHGSGNNITIGGILVGTATDETSSLYNSSITINSFFGIATN